MLLNCVYVLCIYIYIYVCFARVGGGLEGGATEAKRRAHACGGRALLGGPTRGFSAGSLSLFIRFCYSIIV